MDNTTENKMRYFAVHWGQEVLRLNPYKYPYKVNCGYIGDKGMHLIPHLELKSIQSISDEEALEIARICWDYDWDFSDQEIKEIKNAVIISASRQVADHLRHKGYALPFMDLSIKQLQEYGWLKIKE